VTAGADEPALDRRTEQTLRDILAFTAMASRLIARGRPAFDADEALQLAAEAVLHKIGEAVARLPGEFVSIHPEVPWRRMRAARNLVAHRYEQVDYGLIWDAFAQDLPRDADRIRHILEPRTRSGQ
jgi:uncharacterized protein with HEPN domain